MKVERRWRLRSGRADGDINHFTGDMAIGVAQLLSAMLDNHIYWGMTRNSMRGRCNGAVVDMNDRALRDVVASLGGVAMDFRPDRL